MSSFAPPIELDYKITITGQAPNSGARYVGSIFVEGWLDRYPWHELYILRTDGDVPRPQIIVGNEPTTLGMNPGMLIFPSYSFWNHQSDARSVVINCSQTVSDLDRIKDILELSC